jgi:arginyl-tRNA synthetase
VPMNIFAHFETLVSQAIDTLKAEARLPRDLVVPSVTVELPRDPSHGDLASNAAMVLAKPAGMKPRDIALAIVEKISANPDIEKAEVAGPGFINLTLARAFWPRVAAAVLEQGADYGRSHIGGRRKVNVEYVSANPTGPLHVGHCRGAVFGDALANLLDFADFDVTREYYINDAGTQVDVLARSAYLRYREALGEDIGTIPEGLYPGDYLKPVGEALAQKHGKALLGKPESQWLADVRSFTIDAMLAAIKDDLAELGIAQDVFFSERSLISGTTDKVAETIEELRAQGLVFEGRLPPPKGEPIEDWEDREQTLFRATAFGDDLDRALKKSDGTYTYFASDMAYHRDKFLRGFTTMIDVWGADHAGHIKRMVSAVKAISGGKAELDIKICQLVRLFRAGEPVKMSKRAGTFVTLRDVVDEVGRDPVRFMMLYRKNDSPLDFDLAKVLEKARENPVFYVQYAHARTCSVFRMAAEAFPELTVDSSGVRHADVGLLSDDGEIAVIRKLAQYPRLIEQAAQAHEPHRIAFYLYDLASAFHAQYNRGKDVPHLRFIRENERTLTAARLGLVAATRTVIASGLCILGVHAPTEMR